MLTISARCFAEKPLPYCETRLATSAKASAACSPEKLNFLLLKLAQLFSKLGFSGGNGIE